MGEMLYELRLSVNCLHASAIGLPTSCSPEHQLPKSVCLQVHSSTFPHFLSIALLFLSTKKKTKNSLPSFCFRVVSNVNMLLDEPRVRVSELNDRAKSNTGDISVDSAGVQVGSFIHSLHHGAVNSFSYPVKGRVNPPSI